MFEKCSRLFVVREFRIKHMSYYYPYHGYQYPQEQYYYCLPSYDHYYPAYYHFSSPQPQIPQQPTPSPSPVQQGSIPTVETFEEERQEAQNERNWYTIERREGKRIYVCNECSKEFTRAFNLKDHFKSIHLQVRPYQCPFQTCESSFVRKNDCMRHMKLIHKRLKSLK